MLPKPSLVLQVRLRPEEYSDTAAAEIKRSYMYLAQSVVSELDEGERAEGNLMRLNVRLMKPFWDASDPAAEQLWRASFMPWLVNATRNMSTAMHNYNTVLHPLGAGNVTYQWADFDFAPHAVLRLKVDDENRIPSEAPALCDKVRTLAAEGVFDENVARIRIPSRASLAAQKVAFEEEQARYRAALAAQNEAAEDEAAVPAETAAEGEGWRTFVIPLNGFRCARRLLVIAQAILWQKILTRKYHCNAYIKSVMFVYKNEHIEIIR